ncbi:MAG: hypothetical protein CMH53_10360 [Myxococcales bacterium]|nr:hypothetical protein [Myxococcales bacterium]
MPTSTSSLTTLESRLTKPSEPLSSLEEYLDKRVRRAPRLYMGTVRGRRFAHDPEGHNALVVLSRFAASLLDHAWGEPLSDVLKNLAAHGLRSAHSWREIRALLRSGVLRCEGYRPDRIQKTPTFNLWMHLTNACNLNCPYCYISKSKDRLTSAAERAMLGSVDATAASGRWRRIHARYAGGEPMLQFEAMKRLHHAAKTRCEAHGVEFSAAVLTNGTIVPEGAPQWLARNGVGLSVSIDGLGQVQDQMRPRRSGGGSFSLLEAGLDQWCQAGLRPYVLITVGDANLDTLPQLTSWLLERGLAFRYSLVRDLQWGQRALSDSVGAGQCGDMRADHLGQGALTAEQLDRIRKVFHRCYDRIEAHVAAQIDRGERVVPPFRGTHHFCDLSLWRPISKACGAGETYAALGDRGALSPCQAALHSTDAGRLDESLSLDTQLQRHKPFGNFRRELGNQQCNNCRHKPSCAGGCPLLLQRRDGHIDGRSPYCEVFRAVIPRILRIAALEATGAQSRARSSGVQ